MAFRVAGPLCRNWRGGQPWHIQSRPISVHLKDIPDDADEFNKSFTEGMPAWKKAALFAAGGAVMGAAVYFRGRHGKDHFISDHGDEIIRDCLLHQEEMYLAKQLPPPEPIKERMDMDDFWSGTGEPRAGALRPRYRQFGEFKNYPKPPVKSYDKNVHKGKKVLDRPKSALMDFVVPNLTPLMSTPFSAYQHSDFTSRERMKQMEKELAEVQALFATGELMTVSWDEYEEIMEAQRKELDPDKQQRRLYTITFTTGGRPIVFLSKERPSMEGFTLKAMYGPTPVGGFEDYDKFEKIHNDYRESRQKSSQEAADADQTVQSTEADQEVQAAEPISVTPPPPPVLPDHVTYLVIGAGTAAFSALRSIKSSDPNARVLVVGEENRLPYMRPPLSKELWFSDDLNKEQASNDLQFKSWSGKTRSIYYEGEDFYMSPKTLKEDPKAKGVALLTGHKVVSMNAQKQTVTLDTDQTISYNRCLIATGGRPITLPLFDKAPKAVRENVTVFRNVEDFKRLEELTRTKKTIGVVGGGFLGSELACALAQRGRETGGRVIQMFPEKGNMGKVLPQYLTEWTTNKVRAEGVEVLTSADVTGTKPHMGQIELSTSQGDKVLVDHVVVAVGLQPNTDLAKSARLEVDPNIGGYRVNAELEARSNIWVAGDASSFYDIHLGRRRVEHHDHAVVSGRLAGENMTGAQRPYYHQSMFWSDLGPDVGYEAIGIVDSSLPTVAVWAKATAKDTPAAAAASSETAMRSEMEEAASSKAKPGRKVQIQDGNIPINPESYGKGVIFYMRENRVVGIVMWNVFGRMPVARRIIAEGKENPNLSEVAKLFRLHSSD